MKILDKLAWWSLGGNVTCVWEKSARSNIFLKFDFSKTVYMPIKLYRYFVWSCLLQYIYRFLKKTPSVV